MALDPTYQPKTYRQQGGDEFVVAASGAITIESSGAQTVESGGTIETESGATLDLQSGTLYKDTTLGINTERNVFVDKKAWTGVASTAGAIGNWQAPTGSDVIIVQFEYDVTTAATTAGCVIDIGLTETSAVTLSDTLIDGVVATGTITGVKNSQKHAGTNGLGAQRLAAGKWITGSATDGQADSLVGNIYVHYIVV